MNNFDVRNILTTKVTKIWAHFYDEVSGLSSFQFFQFDVWCDTHSVQTLL